MEFLKYLQKFYFWMITQMKKENNFHVQPHAFAKRLLIFCQFQLGVAYESVAYKKACVASKTEISSS